MALTPSNYRYEVLVNDVVIRTVGPPGVTESLDSFATVCEFSLASNPDPQPRDEDAILIRRVDPQALTSLDVFGGYVGPNEVESHPHSYFVRGVDELDKFNRVRVGSDLNLTGLTEGEAWATIADACGVIYDPDDIQDAGYVLGEHADVFWHVDQAGADVISELDNVFAMKTMTVLNNRVVRFAYDLAPEASAIQRTYEKGVDAEWFKNRKGRGTQNQKQNRWKVTGTGIPCDDDCNCMVWARAVGTEPRVSSKLRRQGEQSFSSDLIQDETLARAIATRLMRWYNRVPITITAEMLDDPNVHPGSVLGFIDTTYGIDDFTVLPATVTSLDRRGAHMSITAVGGIAGLTGTITSGVEKRCNKTDLDIDWETDWTTPDFGFPPFGISVPWAGAFAGGLIPVSREPLEATAGWDSDDGTWIFSGNDVRNLTTLGEGGSFFGGHAFLVGSYDGDVTMTGTIQLGDRCALQFGLEDPVDFYSWDFRIHTPTTHVDPEASICDNLALVITTPDANLTTEETFCWEPDLPITFSFVKEAGTLEVTLTQDLIVKTLTMPGIEAASGYQIMVWLTQDVELSSESTYGFQLTDFEVTTS